MLVAIKSFAWRDPDLGLISLTAGRDQLAEDHPMLKDRGVRANFASADPRRLRPKRVPALAGKTMAPTGDAGKPLVRALARSSLTRPVSEPSRRVPRRHTSEPVELRERLGKHAVVIGSSARRLIDAECFAHRYEIEEHEIEATGGGLFGPALWSWQREAYVASAILALSNCWRNYAELDIETIVAHARSLKCRESPHVEIGTWHPHPGTGDSRPSPGDLEAWLSGLNWLKSGTRYVSLIATRGAYGWASPPRLHAWVMYRDRFGDAICERAAVREAGARLAA
jgi:hypothetical protein